MKEYLSSFKERYNSLDVADKVFATPFILALIILTPIYLMIIFALYAIMGIADALHVVFNFRNFRDEDPDDHY
jgi:hypothetical protein